MVRQKKQVNAKTFFTNLIVLLLPCILFLFFIIKGISLPYVGYNAWNFNTYSLIAHNYNTFGFIETKLAPLTSVSQKIPKHPEYYVHHPPLVSIAEAIIFRIFGEAFWSGRLTVIIFASGSLIFLHLIAKELYGFKAGIIAAFTYALFPASVLFGRMIGQEPLVLFFVLSSVYTMLLFLKTKRNIFKYVLFGSVFLGSLSDWPMVYFTFCIFSYLYRKKEKRLGIQLMGISLLTAFMFFLYASLLGGANNLITAFLTRSPGALVSIAFWPVRWILTIFMRFFFYFNPLIFTFSCFVIGSSFVKLIHQKVKDEEVLIISLFIFGMLHILLYPEGSFGHPYWIYYVTPSIVLAFVSSFSQKKLLLGNKRLFLLGIVSFVYLWGVNTWKTKEIEGNVFRYQLAQRAEKYLTPYESILINKGSAIDQDLLRYSFKHPSTYIESASIEKKLFKHVVYSCMGSCHGERPFQLLHRSYGSENISMPQASAYVFHLEKKAIDKKITEPTPIRLVKKIGEKVQAKKSIFKHIYETVMMLTGAPQL